MSKKFLSPEDFALPEQAIDLVKESVRSGIEYDAFGDRQTFTALALTDSRALTKVEASGYGAAYDGLNLGSGLRYKFKGRIIDENSPHSFLPDPCSLAKTGNMNKTNSAIAKHTDFIQVSVAGNKVSAGDIVEVTMRKNVFSYDLQVGVFNKVLAFNAQAASLLKEADCTTLAATFEYKAMPAKIDSVDLSDIADIAVVRNKTTGETVITPEIKAYVQAVVKQLKFMEADTVNTPEPAGGYIRKLTLNDGFRDPWNYAKIIWNYVDNPSRGWQALYKMYGSSNYILRKLKEQEARVKAIPGEPNLAPWVKIFDQQAKKKVYLSKHQINSAVDFGTTMMTVPQIQYLAKACKSLGSSASTTNYGTRSILGEPVHPPGYWKAPTTVALTRAQGSPDSRAPGFNQSSASDEHLHVQFIAPTPTT